VRKWTFTSPAWRRALQPTQKQRIEVLVFVAWSTLGPGDGFPEAKVKHLTLTVRFLADPKCGDLPAARAKFDSTGRKKKQKKNGPSGRCAMLAEALFQAVRFVFCSRSVLNAWLGFANLPLSALVIFSLVQLGGQMVLDRKRGTFFCSEGWREKILSISEGPFLRC